MNTSPSEPLWVALEDVLEAQREQIQRFGGAYGIHDLGLIESAVHRPKELYAYGGEGDILTLAVRLGVGIAKNHGFVDGNKRTGVVSMIEFLVINGFFLDMPNDTTLGGLFEAVVRDRMTEEELAEDIYPYLVEI